MTGIAPLPQNHGSELADLGGCLGSPQLDVGDWQNDVLVTKTFEIVRAIGPGPDTAQAETISSLGQIHPTESLCVEFFSPPRLRKYLELYWEM